MIQVKVFGCGNCPFMDYFETSGHHVCKAFRHVDIQRMVAELSKSPNHKVSAAIGYPVRLPNGLVPEEHNPASSLPNPPDWCPLLLAKISIELTVGIGSL